MRQISLLPQERASWPCPGEGPDSLKGGGPGDTDSCTPRAMPSILANGFLHTATSALRRKPKYDLLLKPAPARHTVLPCPSQPSLLIRMTHRIGPALLPQPGWPRCIQSNDQPCTLWPQFGDKRRNCYVQHKVCALNWWSAPATKLLANHACTAFKPQINLVPQ